MSFSSDTKNEIARIYDEDRCCQIAELAGIVRLNGTVLISANNQIGLEIRTENAALARKVLSLAKKLFAAKTEIKVLRKNRLKKNNIYMVRIPHIEDVSEILTALGITEDGFIINSNISKELIKKKCCRRSYLRGSFLGAGSITDPETSYHLEIVTEDGDYAKALVKLFHSVKLSAKISERKSSYVVYLKESEQIVTFLNIIGAHSALLEFENIRIEKDLRNQVNRLVNCETANINKTIEASLRQVENIKLIMETIGLRKLDDPLQEVAELRLRYPYISLKELGEKLEPKLGKSGINHRMRKIENIANRLKK